MSQTKMFSVNIWTVQYFKVSHIPKETVFAKYKFPLQLTAQHAEVLWFQGPRGMKEATMSESCLPASAFSLSHHHSMFEHAAAHV